MFKMRYGEGVDDFIKNFEEHTDEILSSKESAIKYLISMGIYEEDGKLSKEYK